MRTKMKCVKEVWALTLLGNIEETEQIIHRSHKTIKDCDGFVAIWKVEGDDKFGQPSNLGRYTIMLLFDTFRNLEKCGNKLIAEGCDSDKMGCCPVPLKLKKKMPVYSSYCHDERFIKAMEEARKNQRNNCSND